MKTFVATPANRERNWVVVDATGKTLGRLATQIADVLRGKRKPEYTPHCDVGDFVIVVNAEKISVTGNKREQKIYHRHSGYPGGLKSRTLEEMLERRPAEVIRLVNADIGRLMSDPQVLERMNLFGFDPAPMTPEEMAELISVDMKKSAEIVKRSGATADRVFNQLGDLLALRLVD